MQKLEEKSKQFLVEDIIHGIEFKNPYNIDTEKSLKLLKVLSIMIK